MRDGPRTIRWQDHEFHFESFKAREALGDQSTMWAVWWHSEFIGTMPKASEETTKEFELRCIGWLADLIH